MRALLLCSFLLFLSFSGYAQSGADLCSQATVLDLSYAFCGNASDTFTGNNSGAGSETHYPRLTGCGGDGALDGPAADVWYRFTPVTHQITLAVIGLSTPNLAVFRGEDCRFLTAVACASASPGSGSANLKVNVEPDETYFLMVSGGNPSDQGTFDLTITSTEDCDACLQEGRFLISPPPLRGTYYPYQEALFRFTVEEWEPSATAEWLHALEMQHGPGWAPGSLTPQPPPSCSPPEYWDYYPIPWQSCNTGEIVGPGFAYESGAGLDCGGFPLDGDPGNNWGQGGNICEFIGTATPPLEFQWSLRVNPCATSPGFPNTSLNTHLQVLTDSEAGSYNLLGCNTTGTFRFLSNDIYTVSCNPFVPDSTSVEVIGAPDVTVEDPLCPGTADGRLTVYGGGVSDTTNLYDFYLFDTDNHLLYECEGCTSPFVTPDSLAAGFYSMIVALTGTPVVRSLFITIPDAPVEDLAATANDTYFCLGDTIRLGISPEPEPAWTFEWSGPNDFASNEPAPVLLAEASGVYVVTVTDPACGEYTAVVSLQVAPPAAISASRDTICPGDGVILTATGGTDFIWSTGAVGNTLVVSADTSTLFWVAATNSQGCIDTAYQQITVVQAPPAPELSCGPAGLTSVSVEWPPVDGAAAYQLSTGNGFGITLDTTAYQLEGLQPGETVTITVLSVAPGGCARNAGGFVCMTLSCDDIGLEPAPVDPLCLDAGADPVQLAATVTGIPPAGQLSWSGPGLSDTLAGVFDPQLAGPGEHWISVLYTESTCLVTDSFLISVAEPLQADFNVSADTVFAGEPLTVQFPGTAPSGAVYTWDTDGGAPLPTGPGPFELTWDSPGEKTIELMVAAAPCGPAFAERTVVVLAPGIDAAIASDQPSGCAPHTVQFSAQVTGPVQDYQWTFPGGDPAVSTDPNPVVSYETPGVYGVTLVVSNPFAADTVFLADWIAVEAGPAADFTINSAPGQTEVGFDNGSQNADSYQWFFGDGSASTETSPDHDYGADGDYFVTLIATNDCGSDTLTQNVTIVTAPQAGFDAATTSGCAPLTVPFTNASSVNAANWSWTFPGGDPAVSTQQNPTVSYAAAGTYDVILVVTNAAGADTLVLTDYIAVEEAPAAAFTQQVDGDAVQFFNNSTGATSYLWDFGDGNASDDPAPAHTYAEDGTYVVTLTAINSCGSTVATDTLEIDTALPSPAFIAQQTEGCAPFTVTFVNQTQGEATGYQWQFPGGVPAASTEENPTVLYEEPGVYSVTLLASNANGAAGVTQMEYIVVETLPEAAFTFEVVGQTVQFEAVTGPGWSYEWSFGSTLPSPVQTFDDPGVYEVTLTVTNACGSVTVTEDVEIFPALPSPAFSASRTTGCAPLTVVFENQTQGEALGYEWEFPGGDPAASTEENPTVVYQEPGVYSVTLLAFNADGAVSVTDTAYIEVLSGPAAAFIYDADELTVQFTADTAPGWSYAWDFGDGMIAVAPNPSHTYAAPGAYTVTLVVGNDCGLDTAAVELELMTNSVFGTAPAPGIELFPNPGPGNFTLRASGLAGPQLRLRLYDAFGRLLLQESLRLAEGSLERRLNWEHFPAGCYLLQLQDEKKVFVRKLIIDR